MWLYVMHVGCAIHRLIAFFDPFVTLLSEKSQRLTSLVVRRPVSKAFSRRLRGSGWHGVKVAKGAEDRKVFARRFA